MLVGAISINSFFSFWKLDYFSDMNCLKNPLSDMISCSSSTQLITLDIIVRYCLRLYSLNIDILIGEIPTKGLIWVPKTNVSPSNFTKIKTSSQAASKNFVKILVSFSVYIYLNSREVTSKISDKSKEINWSLSNP